MPGGNGGGGTGGTTINGTSGDDSLYGTSGDTDGDGSADFLVLLLGSHSLSSGDFILG